jgi:hypothetical protein
MYERLLTLSLGYTLKAKVRSRKILMAAKELPQHQQQPLKTLYELGKNAHFHEVYIHKLGQQLGLGTVQYQSGRD